MSLDKSRTALLHLYKKILRSCQTYPSIKRKSIYQAIREEWRDHKNQESKEKIDQKIAEAYKGLQQLRQYDEMIMSQGNPNSPNWTVNLEMNPKQNPIPKPHDDKEQNKKGH
jgi:Complex 1 protein (LYR family)